MYLKKISMHNFKCFEDMSMDFHPQLTVIVGANGAGKTTLMEAAAIAVSTMFVKIDGLTARKIEKGQPHKLSYSIGSAKECQEQYPVEISAEAGYTNMDGLVPTTQELHWTRNRNSASGDTLYGNAKDITSLGTNYQDKVRQGNDKMILPILAYYGTGRLWDYHREKKNPVYKVNNRLNGYIDCVDGTANIKLMMNWFLKMTVEKYQNQELGKEELPELTAVYSAMETCFQRITGYQKVKMQFNMGTKELEVAYQERDAKWMRLPINQLSDGYKSTISLVADIAYRMAVLNPQLLGNICKETDGIIIIDEIDLHLHPAWQQRILGDLMSIFPKVQFIVSTHAPSVISCVTADNLRILDNGQIESPAAQVYGDDVNSLLKRIMGVPERNPETARLFEGFYAHLQKGQFDEAGSYLDKIEVDRDYHDTELAGCRTKLKLERIRRGLK